MGSEAASAAGLADGALARAVCGRTAASAAAESELCRRFIARVRLYGLKHLRDRTLADDLAQQVMLIVIERLRAGEVRDPDQVASFILSTSRMVAGSLRRTSARREELRDRYMDREPSVTTDEVAVDAGRIAPCLASVSERERAILLMTFYAEKSSNEVGRSLGMSPVAVRVARHRALASMRACLETRARS